MRAYPPEFAYTVGVKTAYLSSALRFARNIAVACALSLVCAGQAAPEECTTGEMRPIVKDPPGKKVLREKKDARDWSESFRLDASTAVKVMQGGCAHHGVQIEFEIAAQSAIQAGTRVSTALILLKKLAPHVETYVVADILRVLEKHKGKVMKPEDIIQDPDLPDVTITLEQQDVGKKRRITIGYSFAL